MASQEGLYARAHKQILDIIPSLKGETLTREQWQKLLNVSPYDTKHKDHRDAINRVLWNLSTANQKKVIVKNGSGFKVVDDSLVPINFLSGGGSIFDLLLPFGIHQYCFLYRKNIMIVFGSKDAGKTALLLNIAKLNMRKHRVMYFSSEMVADELAGRMMKYDGLELTDWNIEAYERSYDFNEVIDPDALNIVDFLELGGDESEYYKGVSLVRRIYDKLENGVAIIACQKNKDADFPKGGSGLLEKARIAVSLDPGEVKLTVAKNWADDVTISPRGKAWTYKLVGGINIVNPQESLKEE
ncbi:hypothetical protein LCGC14_1452460 [marine sediment metagenome]|uniref:Uncharacterized protein n=1 Tax=marine sediment metagenome TaxID=412755 RepID=A0A0F9JHF6_9ZZZZ|nr:hypothetical protein [Pricia sp.]